VKLAPAGASRPLPAAQFRARESRAGARLLHERPLNGPRGVGSLLDLGHDVLVERFGVCVGIGLLFWLPLQVAIALASRSSASPEVQLGVLMLLRGLSLVPKFLTTAFVCLVVAGHVLERPVPTADATRRGLSRLPGLLCLIGMQLLGTLLLLCACVLPALLAPWLFAIVPAVYVLEGRARGSERGGAFARWSRGIREAFERGLRLVLGWDSLARFYGYSLVAFLTVTFPLSTVVGSLEAPAVREHLDSWLGLSGAPVDLALILLAATFVAIGTAYAAILDTVFYFDQRVRREGLDLELALARLESAAGGAR
jgi:hypothetical protein